MSRGHVYDLDQWAMHTETGGDWDYMAPEARPVYLSGRVNGKPRTTSHVVTAEGAAVMTKSGSMYMLGERSADYVAFMEKQGLVFDPAKPIRVRR